MNKIYRGLLYVSAALVLGWCANVVHAGNEANSGSQSAAGAEAAINFDDHSTNIAIDRDFAPNAGNVTAHTQGLFVQGNGRDASFRRVIELIRFGDVISESSLRNMARGGDVEYNFTPVNDFDKPANKLADGQRHIKIIVEHYPGFRMSAPFMAEADDFNTNSYQVLARMALKALDNGDNVLFVEFEGYKDKVGASGWGIGTHTTGAVVDGTGSMSGVAGGGFGYSSNQTGAEMMPWIRGFSGSLPYELSPGWSSKNTLQNNSINEGR